MLVFALSLRSTQKPASFALAVSADTAAENWSLDGLGLDRRRPTYQALQSDDSALRTRLLQLNDARYHLNVP